MRASEDSDRRRHANSGDEPPPFGRAAAVGAGRPQQQHPFVHSLSAPNSADPMPFEPVLPRAHSLSTSSNAAAPLPPMPYTARRSTAGTNVTTATAATQGRRSAFHRTFSEAPAPLPTPFRGLVDFLLVHTGLRQPPPPPAPQQRAPLPQQEQVQQQRKKKQEKGAAGDWAAAVSGAAAAAAAALEEGRGGDDEDAQASLRDLRARYISNSHLPTHDPTAAITNNATGAAKHYVGGNKDGVHDLLRFQWESIIDDPWIEEIRAQDFLMKLAVALQRYGSPVPRTEAILTALAPKLHVTGQFYLLPNLLLCAFGIDAASETHMLRCPQDLDAFRYRKTSHLVNLLLAADDLRETLEGKESEDEDEEGAAGESDRLILGALVDGDEGDGGNGQAAGKGRNDKGAAAPAAASAVAVGAGVGNKKEAQEQGRRPPRIRSLPEAVAKLDSIVNSPPLYSKAVIFACHLVSAFAGALVFWRGDWLDAAVAAVATVFVALVVVPGSDHFFVAKVQTLLSAILTGVVGTAGSIFLEAPCSRAIFYAPLTVLFTGWSLTFSLMEFSMGIPLIGTVRMANALVTGLLIGYGIQIGHDAIYTFMDDTNRERLAEWATNDNCAPQPWYIQLGLFPFFIGVPYAILMHAAPAQWPAMVLSAGGVVALMAGPLAKAEEHLAVFLVACAIGLFSNVYARVTASPALIIIVNATFMVVPGSMAVSTAKAFYKNNLAQGWTTAVSMLLIAISIASGLLVAQGLVLTVATWGPKLCCCRHPNEEDEERERRRKRRGQIRGGIDSVYF